MTRLLFLFFISFFISVSASAAGFFDSARDPATGMIDCRKIFGKYKPTDQAFDDTSGMEVKSIRKDSDNKVTVTMGDGRKEVYEKDVFHPEKGWKRTY